MDTIRRGSRINKFGEVLLGGNLKKFPVSAISTIPEMDSIDGQKPPKKPIVW
jgi:hypothetical protein